MDSTFCQPSILKCLRNLFRVKRHIQAHEIGAQRAREYRSAFYRSLWHDAATQLGATVEELGDEILQIRLEGACARVRQNTTAIDDASSLEVAKSKPVVHRLLSQQGVVTPQYCQFTLDQIARAVRFLERIGSDCVVKPADGGGGEGITTGVSRAIELACAAAFASLFDSNLLIEQQVKGDVYRLLYLDGRLIDAVLRMPPSAIADGNSTVRQLVRLENERRLKGGFSDAHSIVQIDLDMKYTLSKQGLTLRSIPGRGMIVRFKTVINDNSRLDNFPAARSLCRSIVDDGAAAAEVVGVRFAGVDVVTPNPSLPLVESGGAILEVNATPSYHHHYHQVDSSFPVAEHILPQLLRKTRSIEVRGAKVA
jgi:glutathione synthase/RimK-type ligase-like ATP-grasp enzyme